jgi:hypothetical protein
MKITSLMSHATNESTPRIMKTKSRQRNKILMMTTIQE